MLTLKNVVEICAFKYKHYYAVLFGCLQRPGCVEKARQTLTEPTDVTLDEYIPDRFLCSGGTSGYQDAITCKGLDSVLIATTVRPIWDSQ